MTVTIWHNPRCSKSRQTLALLRDRGIAPEIVDYLKTPPDEAAIRAALHQLGIGARDLLRKGEPAYAARRLSDESLTDDALVKAMAEDPVLIERPVVFSGGKAALGRPPEAVLDILST